MTTVQLNAQIWRDMGILADSEAMMKRVAKYLRKLVKEREDHTLMTKEEFFARLDKAEKEIADGKGITFTNRDDMNAWLNSL
jgi:uncharacterized short protein YbdD (DUF466 family)